eukprot:Nk52_evm20s158 gene=Nk52_evmTU20s158
MSFVKLLFFFYYQIRSFFALYWLRLCTWINYSAPMGKASDTNRKIVVFGDGYAEGFGDWNVVGHNPGVCGHVENEIIQAANLRQKWQVRACGSLHSASVDWIPNSPGLGKGLFTQMMNNSEYNDAHVYMVTIGSEDPRGVVKSEAEVAACAQATFANIKAICAELCTQVSEAAKHNVVVSVAYLPKAEGDLPLYHLHADKTNALLDMFFQEEKEKKKAADEKAAKENKEGASSASSSYSGHVVKGASLHFPHFNFSHQVCFDGRHYSSTGYKNVGIKWFNLIRNELVQFEWGFFKGKL